MMFGYMCSRRLKIVFIRGLTQFVWDCSLWLNIINISCRTMMVLWNYRTLSPEQRMDMIANIEQGEDSCVNAQYRQIDEPETFLGVDEANLSQVYSTELPLSVSRSF